MRTLGADGIGTPTVAIGQIATVSTGGTAGPIAGQSQQDMSDVTTDIGGSATTGTVTGNMSKAIVSLGMAWSGTNVTIGQAGVCKPVTDSFINMAYTMLVGRCHARHRGGGPVPGAAWTRW